MQTVKLSTNITFPYGKSGLPVDIFVGEFNALGAYHCRFPAH
jgi:hypothetical protein